MNSKRSVKRFLALYFLVFFGAIFLRVDYFPFSWVPMYGYHIAGNDLTVGIGDKDRRARGFDAWRANGEQISLSASDLNIPAANFRRLYQLRAFNHGPPQDDRERIALMAFNKWWYETLVGPDPRLNRRYPQQLLESVNKTFGYDPDDPRRIVRLDAQMDFATFSRADVASGELSRPAVDRRAAMITEEGVFIVKDGRVQPLTSKLERELVE